MDHQLGFSNGSAFGGNFGDPYGGAYSNGGRGRSGPGRRDDHRRGGARGRGGTNGHASDRPLPPESSSARFRKMVVKIGEEEDFMPIEDPPRLAKALRRLWNEGSQGVFDGFRIGVTQQPHKHHHYVSLLLHLSRQPSRALVEDDVDPQVGEKRKVSDSDRDHDSECGKEVLEDLNRAFRNWVEGREWRNVRLCLQFFSLLAPAGLVTGHSLLETYKSLLSVLNEVGGGGERAERVIRAVGEGLIRSGKVLFELFPEEIEGMMASIEMAVLGRRGDRALINHLSPILPVGEEREPYQDSLNSLLSALHALRDGGYLPPDCLPRYWEAAPSAEGTIQSESHDITTANMPPELYEVDEHDREAGEGRIGSIALFAEDVVPSPSTSNGWTLQSIVLDIIHVFEVNRKECATVLLALRRDVVPDTFKAVNPPEDAQTSSLSLESLIVSTLLNAMLVLPASSEPSIYYGSVFTELCKLSPNTVAPPVGRAVRKIFSLLGSDGLDVEVAKRTSDWFAVHLSNFGFQWMWKEWVTELELPPAHPRRAFMRRVVELEIRLAYHDRIMQTLPDAMLAEDSDVIPAEPPEPVWPYEKDDHPLHAEAVQMLMLFRQKSSAAELRAFLQTLCIGTSGQDETSSAATRQMASETLLHLGSRSFSHFLNATERYLEILRYLTPDPRSRRTLLDGIASYWRQSSQMRLVTVDKYLQYGVLEGLDVVDWVFAEDTSGDGGAGGDGWTDGEKWEMLRMCLDKHVGKVAVVKKRVGMVEKEDEAAKARRAAEKLETGEGVGEDHDDEPEGVQLERSKETRDAQTLLDINMTKLEKILITTTKAFVADLVPWCFDAAVPGMGLKAVLTLLENGEEGWWGVRARWGWWREFVRRYSNHLSPLASMIEKTVFNALPDRERGDDALVEGQAEGMVKGVWEAVIGQI